METILTLKLPLKRLQKPKLERKFLPHRERWFGWLFQWSGGSVQEFGGSRVNKRRHFTLFRWHLFTVDWNEYHNRSDSERADEYLREWSKREKELRMFRLAALGADCADEVKQVIKDSLGVDLDEGTIR